MLHNITGARVCVVALLILLASALFASVTTNLEPALAVDDRSSNRGAKLFRVQESCTDDVSIKVWDPTTLNYVLNDPPDYGPDDELWIYYDVENFSCQDVTVSVVLTGSVSQSRIQNAASDGNECLPECTVASASSVESGWYGGAVGWDLAAHPAVSDERVVATLTILSPSDFADEDATNNISITDAAINVVHPDPAPPEPVVDVTLSGVDPPNAEAIVGETLSFAATVINAGTVAAAPRLSLYLGSDETPVNSNSIGDIAPGDSVTQDIAWDTSAQTAGQHALRMVATTPDETLTGDNEIEITVTLRDPVVDVRLSAVEPSHSTAIIGQTVTFQVSVSNDGESSVEPTVGLFVGDADSPVVTVQSPEIAPGGVSELILRWDTSGASAGNHSVRIAALAPKNTAAEAAERRLEVRLHNSVDLGITSAQVLSEETYQGNRIPVAVTVENTSDFDAEASSVTLHIRGEASPVATASIPLIGSHSSETVELRWDTSGLATGQYDLSATVQGCCDINATNNSASLKVILRNAIELIDVAPAKSNAVVGDSIEYTARLRNKGERAVEDVTVSLYKLYETPVLAKTQPFSIPSGSTVDVKFTWDTTAISVGKHDLVVAAAAPNTEADVNNVKHFSATLFNAIAITDARYTPADPIVGNDISIEATVENRSIYELPDATVKLTSTDKDAPPDIAKDKLHATAQTGAIATGESQSVTLMFETDGFPPGTHQFTIKAELPGTPADTDDLWPIQVTMRNPIVDIELVSVVADSSVAVIGNPVTLSATVTNHGESTIPVPLQLLVDNNSQSVHSTTTTPVAPGATASVSLEWDTHTHSIGDFTLHVVAAADGDVSTGNDSRSLIVRLFHSAFDGPVGSYECSEDVGVNVLGLTARQVGLLDPPRYDAGEILTITYRINNYSCDADVTARLELTGTTSGAGISDPTDECLSGCLIPAGGRIIGAAQWDLLNHPAVQHESVRSAIAVVEPASFADTNPSNDEHLSAQWIDRMPDQDILLSVGSHDRTSGSASSGLGKPTFGVVDVRLVSAHSDSQVPFSQLAAPVTITIANHGEQTEVVTARVIHSSSEQPDEPDMVTARVIHSGSEQSDEPDLVSTHVSVAPGAQSSVVMDVPAARLSVGINDLTVRIATTNDSDLSDNTRSLSIQRMPRQAPYSISDVEIPDRLTPGDDALITVSVTNHGQSPVAVLVDAQVDDASIANAPVSSEIISAGATGNVVLTWTIAETFAPGEYRLVISATDPLSPETASASFGKDIVVRDVHGGTITDVQVTPPVIFLGESTTVLVTFRNDGPTPREFPFDLFLGEGSQPVADGSTGPLASRAIGVARLLWESGSNIDPGEYELRVVGEFDEGTTSVTLIPPVVNVAITEASASRSTLVLGRHDSVGIRATVINLGDQVATVTVNLYEEGNLDDLITSPTTKFQPGQSAKVVMEWPLPSDIAIGEYTLRLMADVAGDSQPDDNRREIPITVRGEYADDELIKIAVQPNPAFLGEEVNVSVSVYNPTGTPLSIPLSLETNGFQSGSNVRNPLVQPEQWATHEFVWRTGNQSPGMFAVTASADFGEHTWNEVGAAHRIATATKFVKLQVNAEIVAMYTSPSSTASRGVPVTVSVEVRNNGGGAIHMPVELTFPSPDKAPERRSPRILPGETTTVEFTWNTRNYEPGQHSLYARLTGSGNITSGSTEAEVQLLLTLPEIAATIETISTHPLSARVGDSVDITVVVRNDGPISAYIPTTIYFPYSVRQPETRSPFTQPGSTSVARFRWRTGNFEPGKHIFRVAIQARNGSGSVVSTRTFTVELLPPEVDFAVLEFFPPDADTPLERGEWVDIPVKLQNLGRYAGRGSILLNDLTADKTLYSRNISLDPGESRVVTFVWKTLRHALGEHRLHVTANAEYDGNHLNDTSDTIKVFVFSDRSITLGVGANLPLDYIIGEVSEPALITGAGEEATIALLSANPVATGTLTGPDGFGSFVPVEVSNAEDLPVISLTNRVERTITVYRLSRLARMEPHACAKFQHALGHAEPSAVICPETPTLVL